MRLPLAKLPSGDATIVRRTDGYYAQFLVGYDLIVYEDLKIQNMALAKRGANSAQNHHLAKSISNASWYQFTQWLQYFAKVHGVIVIAVIPHNTIVNCLYCGAKVKKTLSTRTHRCNNCGTALDRDHNAAKNILVKGFNLLTQYLNGTVGHTESGAKSSFIAGRNRPLAQERRRREF